MNFLKAACVLLLCFSMSFAGNEDKPENPNTIEYQPVFIVGNGQNVFHQGKFGNIANTKTAAAAQLLESFMPFKSGDTALVEVADKTDELGKRHVKVQQYINGLPVVGAEMIVHADKNGDVYAINGHFGNDSYVAHTVSKNVSEKSAVERALSRENIRNAAQEGPAELSYVMDKDGQIFLAWETIVTYEDEEGPQRDRIFADATGQKRQVLHPLYHYAKNRRTHTANNGTSLPGSLVRAEGSGNSGDAALDAAHNNAGTTYDYYAARFGRDSYNGAGATLNSTVHYSSNYNNAFWNGSQMVYGDGDGTTFIPLSQSLDVVAHELTHAVTSSESNLVYSYESGALNEAMSDIFGAATSYYATGVLNSNTWLIGEEIYTPGTPGDALRNMADPVSAGDYDYYPTRYTGSSDNGGVHWNSGIANLAFVLLVEGGTHPRGKTSNTVPAIGMSKAEQIFYRANTVYLSSNSNFEAARNATASAAADLYGQAEVDAVHEAWDAVGVPGTPGGGGGGGGGGDCAGYAETFTGFLTGTGDEEFEPNGTYWYDSNGSTNAQLLGDGTDFDLYLWKWVGYWAVVASGESPDSTETISYNGTSGYYAYRVYSYSGSGAYDLCVNR